ncbi:hypothetical protein ADUPG1_000748, partial [Aduncisulcus paluster]
DETCDDELTTHIVDSFETYNIAFKYDYEVSAESFEFFLELLYQFLHYQEYDLSMENFEKLKEQQWDEGNKEFSGRRDLPKIRKKYSSFSIRHGIRNRIARKLFLADEVDYMKFSLESFEYREFGTNSVSLLLFFSLFPQYSTPSQLANLRKKSVDPITLSIIDDVLSVIQSYSSHSTSSALELSFGEQALSLIVESYNEFFVRPQSKKSEDDFAVPIVDITAMSDDDRNKTVNSELDKILKQHESATLKIIEKEHLHDHDEEDDEEDAGKYGVDGVDAEEQHFEGEKVRTSTKSRTSRDAIMKEVTISICKKFNEEATRFLDVLKDIRYKGKQCHLSTSQEHIDSMISFTSLCLSCSKERIFEASSTEETKKLREMLAKLKTSISNMLDQPPTGIKPHHSLQLKSMQSKIERLHAYIQDKGEDLGGDP